MMLGNTECDEDTKYFLKYGFYPLKESKHYTRVKHITSEFDVLNYLECNHSVYFENPRRSIWGL